MLRFDVITLFPEMFQSWLAQGVLSAGLKKELFETHFHNPRSHALNKYGSIDDRPYGGGEGMLMSAVPLKATLDDILKVEPKPAHVIYLTPSGRPWNQGLTQEFSKVKRLVLICGRYEGIDQRFINRYVTQEISMGDYILSGGEIPAMTLIDSVVRLIPGVLGNDKSSQKESFSENILEHPQFTRPPEFEGMSVPSILLSGDHAKIQSYQKDLSILMTMFRRPDLLSYVRGQDLEHAKNTYRQMTEQERKACGFPVSV